MFQTNNLQRSSDSRWEISDVHQDQVLEYQWQTNATQYTVYTDTTQVLTSSTTSFEQSFDNQISAAAASWACYN